MKVLKGVLVLFFVFHITSLLAINLLYFFNNKLNLPKDKLTSLGNLFFNIDHDEEASIYIPLKKYAHLSGFDKPYEYFSPVISETNIDVVFVDQHNNNIPLSRSIEGDVKIFTFKLLYQFNKTHEVLSEKILKSFTRRLFYLNPGVERIYVYFIINKPREAPQKILIYNVKG